MKCVICGKSSLEKGTLEHIANIKAKIPHVEKESARVLDSDPELAKKLQNKLKKYNEELKQLETGSYAARNNKLCYHCEEEMEHVIEDIVSENNVILAAEFEAKSYPMILRIVDAVSEFVFERKDKVN